MVTDTDTYVMRFQCTFISNGIISRVTHSNWYIVSLEEIYMCRLKTGHDLYYVQKIVYKKNTVYLVASITYWIIDITSLYNFFQLVPFALSTKFTSMHINLQIINKIHKLNCKACSIFTFYAVSNVLNLDRSSCTRFYLISEHADQVQL